MWRIKESSLATSEGCFFIDAAFEAAIVVYILLRPSLRKSMNFWTSRSYLWFSLVRTLPSALMMT